jgi:phosphonate transport system substrate-binding protein
MSSLSRRSACLGLIGWMAALRSAQAQAQAAPLELGVLPNISARVLLTQYQPLRTYLARELQRPVQVSTAPDWTTFHKRTASLDYDIVVTAAHVARLEQIENRYLPLLAVSPNIKGLVVCTKAKPLAGIGELRGQTLVLSNPQSLVTFRGMQWLAENKLEPGTDFKTINTPTDDSVGNVVVRGDAVAAMLSGGEFRTIPEALRDQLQIVATFAEVPGFIVLASPRLAPADAQAIKDKLVRFAAGSDEGKSFFQLTGFTALREPEPGLMEGMDAYLAQTRRALAG